MKKRLFLISSAVLATVLLGAGCNTSSTDTTSTTDTTNSAAQTTGVDLCVRTDGDATGQVRLYAANITDPRTNFDQWFTEKPVTVGNAGDEICGHTTFDVQTGDKLMVNGVWNEAERWLVENRTPDGSGSDNIHEIWINDEFYSVGKECAYQSNGKKGFDIVCTIR